MSGHAKTIAIVGAGVAGAAAAEVLINQGFIVKIVDKGRGVGGRCTTRRRETLRFDHGAQYFTVRDDRFAERVAQWTRAGAAARWDGRFAEWDGQRLIATDPHPRWVGAPKMHAIVGGMLGEAPVHPGRRVEALRRDGDRWRLTCAGADPAGETLGPFDELLLTLPAPQAETLLRSLRTEIGAEIEPGPALLAATGRARLAPCWAMMLAFDRRVDLPADGIKVGDDDVIRWIARDSSKPGRPAPPPECWVVHAGPEWSAAWIDEDADRVEPTLRDAWDALAGRMAAASGAPAPPAPVHVDVHRWRYALAQPEDPTPFVRDAGLGLTLAGDWLLDGKIEAAWRSGVAAAEAIAGVR